VLANSADLRTIRNIWRTVRRICMLILGVKGLRSCQRARDGDKSEMTSKL